MFLPGEGVIRSIFSLEKRRQAIKSRAYDCFKILFFSCALVIFSHENIHAEQYSVLRLSDGNVIPFAQMIQELKKADVIFVGETHNILSHHRLQLHIIKALDKKEHTIAIGFEMFWAESQHYLDQWVKGAISLDDFIKIYYENWNFPWPLYRDILLYIRNSTIPAIGLNVTPEITRKISQNGFSSLSDEELKKLPPETGCVINEQYMQFIRRAYAMHTHGEKQFLYFCQAQLLWDQVMAHHILRYGQQNSGKHVIVLAGNGHAWRSGIPAQMHLGSEKVKIKVVLPEIPGYIDRKTITHEDADFIVLQ